MSLSLSLLVPLGPLVDITYELLSNPSFNAFLNEKVRVLIPVDLF
jgi:hypothetical protein